MGELFQVTEGVEGFWHYHLSLTNTPAVALCGRRTMHTSLPLDMYGRGRASPNGAGISGKWCKECEHLRNGLDIALTVPLRPPGAPR